MVRINEAASEKGGLQKSGLKKKDKLHVDGGIEIFIERPAEETSSVDSGRDGVVAARRFLSQNAGRHSRRRIGVQLIILAETRAGVGRSFSIS